MGPLANRRGTRIDIAPLSDLALSGRELRTFETFDAAYRTLCAMLYNYVPLSGHPGGSISSGRIVSMLLFGGMDYDFSNPAREDADVVSYAAGHKALGLYALWALRNELVSLGASDLLPDITDQLRLEDLLGFRKSPTTSTPLFKVLESRALDGHPTPATPFVQLATGASGVGFASSIGLAFGMYDWYGEPAPKVHIIEGEGGLTPGRVAEAIAFAGTVGLSNVVAHIDWNQSSIDSDNVTAEEGRRGDYVQWSPPELFQLNDWNVIEVPNGFDLLQIAAAQRAAAELRNHQPTAIIYRTTKGWTYGIEGRASHGAGHKLCSDDFFDAIHVPSDEFPRCFDTPTLCNAGANAPMLERCYWQALTALRKWLAGQSELIELVTDRVVEARDRLNAMQRQPRPYAPEIGDVFALAEKSGLPRELELAPGREVTLRGQLGRVLGYLNRFSGGALFISAADLLGSTSVNEANAEFARGFYHCETNQDSRTLAIGGICEDSMSAVLSGISAYGHHIGVGASYGAFMAPLGHIASRLHAIGNQARHEATGLPARPFILICGHAGLKTGEDGPTHADPQPLQLLQENFPAGAVITLTPWDPQEIWYLMTRALALRPSVIAPFVPRPAEVVLNRNLLGLSPAEETRRGLYRLRAAVGKPDGVIVLQESAVTYTFVVDVLPTLISDGIDLDVYYVSSAELFDTLTTDERREIFPEDVARDAMGITGFTLPTMYRWIRSDLGREMTMHPYMHGRYPGSGTGRAVLAEAGLDGESQYRRVCEYVRARRAK